MLNTHSVYRGHVTVQNSLGHADTMWWVNPGWLPSAHHAARSLPHLSKAGKEKQDEKVCGLR